MLAADDGRMTEMTDIKERNVVCQDDDCALATWLLDHVVYLRSRTIITLKNFKVRYDAESKQVNLDNKTCWLPHITSGQVSKRTNWPWPKSYTETMEEQQESASSLHDGGVGKDCMRDIIGKIGE